LCFTSFLEYFSFFLLCADFNHLKSGLKARSKYNPFLWARMMNLTTAFAFHVRGSIQERQVKHKASQAESTPPSKLPDLRDQKTYYTEMTTFRRFATPVLLGGFRLLTRFTVSGAEQLPSSGPVILAANHLTNYDVFFLQAAISRPIFYMGKEELFRNPAMDWLLRQLGGFPVHRGAGDEWALRHAERVLRARQVLGMFPEGTRSKGKGLKPAKTGVARLALQAGCPIVPVALHGPQYMFTRVSRRTLISASFGEAMFPDEDESALGLTDRMMFAMARMLPVEQRGAYQVQPEGF
jgi:1-acyl-sn-glycerol-3-phosphate acyltransferase